MLLRVSDDPADFPLCWRCRHERHPWCSPNQSVSAHMSCDTNSACNHTLRHQRTNKANKTEQSQHTKQPHPPPPPPPLTHARTRICLRQEIINAAKNISTPVIEAPLEEARNPAYARRIKGRIETITLEEVRFYSKRIFSWGGGWWLAAELLGQEHCTALFTNKRAVSGLFPLIAGSVCICLLRSASV